MNVAVRDFHPGERPGFSFGDSIMDPYRIQNVLDVLLASEPANLSEWQEAINTLNELINNTGLYKINNNPEKIAATLLDKME